MQALEASKRIFEIILMDENIEPSLPNKVMSNDRM